MTALPVLQASVNHDGTLNTSVTIAQGAGVPRASALAWVFCISYCAH